MNTKKLLFVFIPALILAGFVFFIQALRYEPLFPKDEPTPDLESFTIPVGLDDPLVGVKRAGKVVVAFEDYSCTSCSTYDGVLTQLVAKYPTAVKIVWKGLPVTKFPYPSEPAILYGYCAQQQNKFAEYKTQAFSFSDQLSETTLKTIGANIGLDAEDLQTCLDSEAATAHLTQNKTIASILNIQAVPTFFINNKQVEIAPTLEAWEQTLGFTPAP